MKNSISARSSGAWAVLFVYLLWGVLPLYWKTLRALDPLEILAHRAVWSCVFSLLLVLYIRGDALVSLFRTNRRALAALALSGATITANWYIYIWAVNSGKILESSLGYFINPLVSMLLGVAVLGERLRKFQWLAMGVAAAGVCAEVLSMGRLPLVSLGLALTFGAYGLLKKLSAVDSLVGLTVETLFITPFALAWLLWRQWTGAAHFPYDPRTALLLAGSGVVTAAPLFLFSWGVKRSAMTTLGILQYTSPILMFLTATLIYRESMPSVRWLSFSLTWAAILLFTAESIRNAKKMSRPNLTGHPDPPSA